MSITAVKPEGVKESKHATFVMPHDLYDEVQEIAKERDLTFSQVGAVSPLSIIQAARHARALGAAEVRGCGIGVHGDDVGDALDAYTVLTDAGPRPRALTAA